MKGGVRGRGAGRGKVRVRQLLSQVHWKFPFADPMLSFIC